MSEILKLDQDSLNTLRAAGVIPDGTPAEQVALFAAQCAQYGLSPFKKQIYLTKRKMRDRDGGENIVFTTIVGIDGFRAIAARTGLLAGADDAKYNIRSDGSFRTPGEIKGAGEKAPVTCTVTVYKVVGGTRCPFTHTAVFDEFASKFNAKWQEMPFQMLAKVAEAFALRKAFGNELSGMSIEEEAAALNGETIAALQTVEIDANEEPANEEAVRDAVERCESYEALTSLFKSDKRFVAYRDLFSARKKEIEQLIANGQIPA